MKNPKISLVIPVYNVAAQLRKCLTSAVNQTLRDIEIILVNDCSPDERDEEICHEFASNDPRIQYIRHSENRRQGGARNTGMEAAIGEYIWFVDSDDFIDINACEFLYSQVRELGADVIAFSGVDYLDSPKRFWTRDNYHYHQRDRSLIGKTLSGKNFMKASIDLRCFFVTCWSHWFRREFISQYKFREGVYREDTDFVPIVLRNATSIFTVSYSPYYHLIRKGSDTQSDLTEKIVLDKFAYLNSLINYAEKHQLDKSDPLSEFTARQLLYSMKVYSDYESKSDETEKAHREILNLCSQTVFAGVPSQLPGGRRANAGARKLGGLWRRITRRS